MKKFLALLMAVVMAAGMSLSTFAADTEVLGDTDFPQMVDGSGKWTSKSVKGKRGASYRIYGYAYEGQAKEVLRIMNAERKAEGLPSLSWEQDLYEPAIQRALEQYVMQSHTRPNGSDWSTVHKLANGENLAGGPIFDASEVMQGWMDSPGHRANILDSDYNSVAVACVETNIGVFWVQLFHSDKKVSADDPDAKKTTDTDTDTTSKTEEPKTSTSGGKSVAAKDVKVSSGKATVKNFESISPAVMKEVAKAAPGKDVRVTFTTSYSGKSTVQGRMAINPAAYANMKEDLKLGVYVEGKDVEKVASNMDKWYKNDVAVIQLAQSGTLPASARITAKPAALKGLDTDNLVFYSYNASTKKVKLLENTNPKVDSKGFLSFNTTRGDFIIVTNGKLAK